MWCLFGTSSWHGIITARTTTGLSPNKYIHVYPPHQTVPSLRAAPGPRRVLTSSIIFNLLRISLSAPPPLNLYPPSHSVQNYWLSTTKYGWSDLLDLVKTGLLGKELGATWTRREAMVENTLFHLRLTAQSSLEIRTYHARRHATCMWRPYGSDEKSCSIAVEMHIYMRPVRHPRLSSMECFVHRTQTLTEKTTRATSRCCLSAIIRRQDSCQICLVKIIS